MCKLIVIPVLTIWLSLSPLSLQARKADGETGCLAISDGLGGISLLWLPQDGVWPAGGWQIQDDQGKILIGQVKAGEEAFLDGFAPDRAQSIRDLARGLPAFKTDKDRKNYFFGLRLMVLGNPDMARAMGLSRTLHKVGAGAKIYRIIGLDGAGKPNGTVRSSATVDAAKATPLPAAPQQFRAESQPAGVAFFWSPPEKSSTTPVFSYRLERYNRSAAMELISQKPILLNVNAPADQPDYIDPAAPVEQESSYQLIAVDVLGRRSEPALVVVFHADHQAFLPPTEIKAEAQKGQVTLTWKFNPSPHVQSVYIERAYRQNGNYMSITPQGLPRQTATFLDSKLPGGLEACYRLRCLGPRQTMGQPSEPVSVRTQCASLPDAPQNLKAQVGRTRIRLSWDEAKEAVSVYIIERQTDRKTWFRINDELDQQTCYDDPLGEETSGTISYRVKAVAFDNVPGPYCPPVTVIIPEKGLPPAPRITAVDGRGGKAVIRFKPGQPEHKSRQFLVLRSGYPDQWGVVMGRPLPADARSYTDQFVAAGETYFYRVVAINERQDRSEPCAAVPVIIGSPVIPTPKVPRLELVDTATRQLRISFQAPPPDMLAIVERRLEGDELWLRLPGTIRGQESLDFLPASPGKILYRVLYLAPDGSEGLPSDPAQLEK